MKIYNNTDGSSGYNYSPKGNQLKFQIDNVWYKSDFLGYEGASEILASALLKNSNVNNFVEYSYKEIEYNNQKFNGCVSQNFLKENESLITAERLFKSISGKSIEEAIAKMSVEDKIKFFVNELSNITKLQHLGEYLTTLFEFDAVILNEDRHFHNIAFIKDDNGKYSYAPIFDNGAGYMSDIRYEYPLEKSIYGLIYNAQAKPFSKDFDKQVQICEKLYGHQLQFSKEPNIENAFVSIKENYGEKISERMQNIYENRYLFYDKYFQGINMYPEWEKDEDSKNNIAVFNEKGCIQFVNRSEFENSILNNKKPSVFASSLNIDTVNEE